MSSDESDDEPLSVLAKSKRLNPDKFTETVSETKFVYEPKAKKRKVKPTSVSPYKRLPLTFKFSKLKSPVVQRPADVWLYQKDLNPTGPYSCLLCSEWFTNRIKLIIHYILNHKKDFCGICRYFVPDRDAWQAHLKFHSPWPCSQCVESFPNETVLRHHMSAIHKLVHCRLCHFRMPDNDQYNTHLFQKHNVTNVSSKDEDVYWELEFEGSLSFLCLLCAKSNNLTSAFFKHFISFHHFTLKCFTNTISGKDTPFSIYGADVSAAFIETLKDKKYGYVELDRKQFEGQEVEESKSDSYALLNELMPEIKEEAFSDMEDTKDSENQTLNRNLSELVRSYRGDEDFDVTLMELVVLQRCYFDYLNGTLNDITSSLVPENSNIDYEKAKSDILAEINCSLCKTKHESIHTFVTHMYKAHSIKSEPIFSCRVCATTFDTQNELDSHTAEEMGDFENLWLCQFCDKEFDNREKARRHLTDHWEVMEYDNCFSPHLGFKCTYCPTLFWNETDRETHQVRVHCIKYKEHFYRCQICLELFSDKIWFIHHYLEKHNREESDLYLFKCSICCLMLPSIEKMRDHFSSEHPEARKVFCSLDSCQYRPLSHKKSFQLHLRAQHSTQQRKDVPVTCSVCTREFPSARALHAHSAQVHGPGKYKCKICKETLHSLDERKLHYLIRHPGHHPFECNQCGKSFQYKSSLYMHKHEHRPNKQSFTCPYCQKVFAKKDSFREHVQIHEGPRHACSYCPMRFVQRSNMLRHERRHTGERPYACPQCDRTFADKGACTSHIRSHSKETSYACLYCGQTFVQKSKLTYHIRKHTGENLETCSVCSKLFTSPCALREHMKVHDAKTKDSVKCPLCDKKYQDERYMLRHLRTSHSLVRYNCPLCKKGLMNPAGLRSHVITHSPLNIFRCKSCPKSYAVKRTILKHLRKRHSIKGQDVQDHYHKLEPRECQLDLDEETMTSIFGPPKKTKAADLIIGDFVTLKKSLEFAENAKQIDDDDDSDENEDNDDNDDDDNDENDKSKESSKESDEESGLKVKVERQDHDHSGGEELEPTDFVSIKIEHMDEDDIGIE